MSITDFFEKNKIKYLENEPLKKFSTFKIGGNADYILFPSDINEIISCIEALSLNGVNYTVIGNGSNLLFSDDGFRGAVIITSQCRKIIVDGNILHALCGSSLSVLSNTAQKKSLTGLEFAYGIPGTCGGAIYMNAGAYGSEISSVISRCTCYDVSNKKMLTYEKNEMNLSYRHSVLMDNPNLIILSAVFSLNEGDGTKSLEIMQGNMKKRCASQPYSQPNAGSIFKKPEGHFAGKLIEDCGLKGYCVGGAMVSTKHAGFIVNNGDATADNVRELIEHIKEKVLSEYGVTLDCEIRFI